MSRSAGFRAAALMIAATLLAPACGGGPTREERIRAVLEEAVSRANHRDVAGLMALCGPDYADFEGRDAARTRELVGGYFGRYRGIVIHLLGVRIDPAGPDGRVPVECEVSLSHGAAEVLRKLIRYAGSFYRFRFELRREPRAGWRFASAGWEEIGPAGLFPESLDLLKELFPGF
jgi:hypothetical protein